MPDAAGGLRVAVLARSVFPLHGYGGLERHVGDLVTHLLRRGVGVTLLTAPLKREPGSAREALIDPFLAQPALEVQCIPYRTFPLAGRRGTTVLDRSSAYLWFGRTAGREAAKLVAARRVAIVHGLGASALGYVRARRAAGRDGRAPFVFNPQGLEEFGAAGATTLGARLKRIGYRPLQAAVRACAAAADRVIATDRSIVPAVRAHLHVDPARIAIVPNAIDLDACDRVNTSETIRDSVRDGPACPEPVERVDARTAPDRRMILLSVGRLEHNKGFHVLAEALAAIADRKDWRWVLVGDGPYRARLEQAIARRGLGDRVRITGRVDDQVLHAWYAAADVFVHPTLYEGSSLVTLEAMAHRKAVIATRAGGLPDKVIPGVTGWLVEPGDPQALRDAIVQALDDPAALPIRGAAGRALVERTFSWTVVADQMLDLYRDLMS